MQQEYMHNQNDRAQQNSPMGQLGDTMQIKAVFNIDDDKMHGQRQSEEEDDGWIGQPEENTYRVKEAWKREKEMGREMDPSEFKRETKGSKVEEDNEAEEYPYNY